MLTIGVILAGCGRYDGSEIHESVLTLLYLSQNGAKYICMAQDCDQYDAINHLTGKPYDDTQDIKRNILVESARIARGDIRDIKTVSKDEIDGLILPGGVGAIKNLSNFILKGTDATVDNDVARVIKNMIEDKKPLGAICIAPATLTKVLGDITPEVTIGNELNVANAINVMGGVHKTCTVEDIVVDIKNKIVTTPAYMLGPEIKDIAIGIEKLVIKVLELAKGSHRK